jgi:hypothetical protein
MVYTLESLDSIRVDATYHGRTCDTHARLNNDVTFPRFEFEDPFTSSIDPYCFYSANRNSDIPSVICSACGHKNYSGEMFCQKCGVQLAPVVSIPPTPPQPKENAQTDLSQGTLFIGRLILEFDKSVIELRAKDGICVLGRSDPVLDLYPEVDLSAFDAEEKGVSRRHARILKTSEGLFIEDLNSTNFTFLNGLRLEPELRYPLNEGDEIRLGYFAMVYRSK